MLALTLWRPWSEAIVRGPKRIENRSWAPPQHAIGQTIAIHAGKKYERLPFSAYRDLGWNPPPEDLCPMGVVGVARLVGFLRPARPGEEPTVEGVGGVHVEVDADWWNEQLVGWVLDQVRPLARAVACGGAQGLWHTVPSVDREIEQQLAGGS